MARTILVGKQGGPLNNAIHAASLRLEEIKFGDLAGVQNESTQPVDGLVVERVVAECSAPFTAADVEEAYSRYGFNNAVAYAKAGVDPLLGVRSSWLDGFLHGAGAMARLQPRGREMRDRWERGHE